MNLAEAFSQIDSMGLSSPKFNLSEMTDEELSHLRFTMFSKEDEEDIMAELKKRGVNGDVDDYYNFFLELTAKLGEDEAFADGLIAENEPLFDLINDEPMYNFYVEEDTEDRELCRRFLEPYYNKAKQLVKHSV